MSSYNDIRDVQYISWLAKRRGPILAQLIESIRQPAKAGYRRPVVTLSYAQSLDGSIAWGRGIPCTLSCIESRTLTHKLRAAHDAILVGINTVLVDNPQLTVRLVEGSNPLPIVLDSHLKLPLDSNLLKNGVPPLIATTYTASIEKQHRIEEVGAKIIRFLPDERGWVELHSLLTRLADIGIFNIMVEGGARVITSFLSQRLVDRVIITITPAFLGGLRAVEYPPSLFRRNGDCLPGLPEFDDCKFEQVGKDIVFWAALKWATR